MKGYFLVLLCLALKDTCGAPASVTENAAEKVRDRRQIWNESIPKFPLRQTNSNAQSNVGQSGWGNSNAQHGVGQVGRRQNSNVQSGVEQTGWGNSNAQEQVGQNQGFYRAVPYLDRRANSNAQSGIQQSGWGNYNAQDFVGQNDFNRQPWIPA